MTNLLQLAYWEWFKLRRRWMPWILLVILVLFAQLIVWIGYLSYTTFETTGDQVLLSNGTGDGPFGDFEMVSCSALREDADGAVPPGTTPEAIADLMAQCEQQTEQHQAQLQQQYAGFTLPGSLPGAFGIASSIGLILLAIMTASVIGGEYRHGTLRPMLVRGIGRRPYLAGKFLMLILAAAGALLVVSVVTALSSLIAGAMVPAPPSGDPSAAPTWSDAGIALGTTWLSFIPFLALTAMLSVLTRSSAAGVAISLGYYFMEGILVALLSAVIAGFDRVAGYLLIHNISAFTAGGFGGGNAAAEASRGQTAIVLVLYMLALGALALAIFQRQDIAGPSGG